MTTHRNLWRKSSYSGTETNCVEVAHAAGEPIAAIRDSKKPAAGQLTLHPSALRNLLRATTR